MKGFDVEEYANKLSTLVNIDSGSNDPDGITKVANYLERQYQNLGLAAKRYRFSQDAGPCLEIRNRPEEKNIDVLLVGHMDTVFSQGTAQERPFLKQGNIAYGPGVADMKAGLVSMLYVVELLVKEQLDLSFCVALNSDEEISSRYSQNWIKKLAQQSEYAFVMEPGRKHGEFVHQRKGLAKYGIKLQGVAAHAGTAPQDGASAIHELAHLIMEITKLIDDQTGTSINVGIISGGTSANVVSDEAECLIDTRFDCIKEHHKIEAALKRLKQSPLDNRVQITVSREGFRPPMTVSEKTKKLMGWMEECGTPLNFPVKWVKTGGASDGNLIAFEGCAVVDGTGPAGEGFHSDRETLRLNSAEARIDLLFQTVMRISKEKEEKKMVTKELA